MSGGSWPVTPTWVMVSDRDGRRCVCRGQCGKRHYHLRKGQPEPAADSVVRRCDVAAVPGRPFLPGDQSLIVGPLDPAVPGGQAWRLPRAALATWCLPCLTAAAARARTVSNRRARRVDAALSSDDEEVTDPAALLF